ncbi:PAS domain S-box protein [Pontibacter sp. SGAir0037]|uniref:PAS domain S-box protein n=1 Tax=Pontibacter sp. SGAir0037 TaxID=2571030 RepID=UPI0010CCF81C|nr:PAS domain S-box protein [Pontibacter sp. SGAir0037]QCR21223.1 PAS domain-containing sensor histidine kinase [Pontibacter sp. SGAir0037]
MKKGFFEKLVQLSPDMICSFDRQGCFLFVSNACKDIMGYENRELVGLPVIDFVHPEDRSKISSVLKDLPQGETTVNFKYRFIHKSGHPLHLLWSATWSEEDEAALCVVRVAPEHPAVGQRLREEQHQALVEHSSDTIALLDEAGNYLYLCNSIRKTLGFAPEEVMGKNAFDGVHPEDLPKVKESWLELGSKDHVQISDYRFRKADGNWIWFETIVSNQLSNPAIRAMVVNARNITERKISELQLVESEQRFRSLFDNNPDMILVEDREGVILDINAAGGVFEGIPREKILNRHFSEFLPTEAVTVSMKHHLDTLSGKTCRFKLEIACLSQSYKVYDILKVPIHVNGKITGVYTLVKDITAITQYHNTVVEQAKKLNTIFESITDAFFTLSRDWHFTYINSEYDRILETNREKLLGKNIWEVYDEEIFKTFYQQYHYAVETGKSVHFEAYLERKDVWLEVKAFPSTEGLSVYFSDVTEKVRSKQELEKLSLVASKTTNGIYITDAQGFVEWVNEGFTRLTGYILPEVKGKRCSSFMQEPGTDKALARRILEKIKQREPFEEEVLSYKKSGERIWVSKNITPVLDDTGQVSRYIVIQNDVTARREAEEAQLELTKDLDKQYRDLQQFTYIVSHNLRAPVANALGYTQLLFRVDNNSELYDISLKNLKTSIINLDMVLKDLNQILSIRDNKDTIEKEKINIRLICQQAVDSLQESLQACGGEVFLNIGKETLLPGNKAYFYSIFYNLLSNAIKYRSPERALKINIKYACDASQNVVLTFSDNGSGFNMEKAGENVFKLYKRFHRTVEGRGIGLFLVKSHVEAMGGHIEVSSQENIGTKFSIYLQ